MTDNPTTAMISEQMIRLMPKCIRSYHRDDAN